MGTIRESLLNEFSGTFNAIAMVIACNYFIELLAVRLLLCSEWLSQFVFC